MASPCHRSGSSHSSPSRTRANGYHVSQHTNHLRNSDLSGEFARMVVDRESQFKKNLDQQTASQRLKHEEALDLALARHVAVREEAERDLERRRIEEETKRLEKEREEAERQEAARLRLAEEKRKKEEAAHQAELRRRQEEEQRVADQKRREEDERARQQAAREKVDAEKRAKEQAAAEKAARDRAEEQERAQVAQPPVAHTNGSSVPAPTASQQPSSQPLATAPPSGITKSAQDCLTLYNQYLEIHGRLKQLRSELPKQAKQDPRLRDLSDWRRELTKLLGQVNVSDKAANRQIIANIRNVLNNCLELPEYIQDISPYFLPSRSNGQPIQGSVLLVFLFHYIVKSAVKSMEANLQPLPPNDMGSAADNFGIILATLFADPRYHPHGHNYADILLSKFHQQCPILFGVRKPIKRPIQCLAAGFASITLRDFSKNRNVNPFPSRLFWEAVARVVNTPPAGQTAFHYQILAMLFNPAFVPRFIQFYGKAGLVALRHALITFPQTAPADKERVVKEAKAVTTLATVGLDRELHLKVS